MQDNFATQLQDALDKDFPDTKLKHQPHPPASGRVEDPLSVFMRAGDHLLRERRERLAQMEFEHRQKVRNLEIDHEKATTALRAEIAVLSGRLGFAP